MTWPKVIAFAVIVLVLWAVALLAQNANVTLAWNLSTNPIVAGINIYFGGASGVYTNKTDAGMASSLTISNLASGDTYYFAATTYSAAGAESALSSEVSYTVPMPLSLPDSPTGVVVNPTNYAVSWPAGGVTNGLVLWSGYDVTNQFTLTPVLTNLTLTATMPTNLWGTVTNAEWTVTCWNVNSNGLSIPRVFHWPYPLRTLTNYIVQFWNGSNLLFATNNPQGIGFLALSNSRPVWLKTPRQNYFGTNLTRQLIKIRATNIPQFQITP